MSTLNESAPSCFDYGPANALPTLSLQQALVALLSRTVPLSVIETLPLAATIGRILAQPIYAPFNVPPHRNAAMDGYAIQGAELQKRTCWTIQGTSLAGKPFVGELQSAHAIRITTGAVMPKGADTVIMQELCKETLSARSDNLVEQTDNPSSQVFIDQAASLTPGMNVREAGEDIQEGILLLPKGHRITSVELGLLASMGIAQVPVYPRIRVAIFSTGDELLRPGETLSVGKIYDTNRYTLLGLLSHMHCEVEDCGILPDNPTDIQAALQQAAATHDLVITSGGASVGSSDYVKSALQQLGRLHFTQVALRPGRPFTFGEIDNASATGRCLMLALPGNPVAVMLTFSLLVQPLLRSMQGVVNVSPSTCHAQAEHVIKGRLKRYDFDRGVMHVDATGQLRVRTTGKQGSGLLTSMYQANCFIALDEQQARVEKGQYVTVYPFSSWVPGYQSVLL